jgi:hypothetical protein
LTSAKRDEADVDGGPGKSKKKFVLLALRKEH